MWLKLQGALKVHIFLFDWGDLGLLSVLTNLPFLVVLSQSATMKGATDSPFQSQHHMGIPSPHASGFPLVVVPSVQQMSPNISI